MEGENNNNTSAEVSEPVEVAVGVEDERLNEDFDEEENHNGVTMVIRGGDVDMSGKRKRGRPRKMADQVRQEFVMAAASEMPQKRGRGRPKGSGKPRHSLANNHASSSFGGGTVVESTGTNFTPHIITVQTGENIVQRICSFSHSDSESLCIISACGTVSFAEILQPGSCGAILKYKGLFEIVSLNGSRTTNARGGQNCVISVQLANDDCHLFGGAIAGLLIAAAPTQLVIATFRQKLRESVKLAKHSTEPSKPKKEAAVPVRTENGKLSDVAEGSGMQPVSAVPAPRFDQMDKMMNVPDVNNHASSQPFTWNLNPMH